MTARLPLGALLLAACATSTPVSPVASGPSAAPVQEPAKPTPEPSALRLPTTVRPVRESLALRIVPSEPTFSGTATLDLELDAGTDHFWLHAQGLIIDQTEFLTAGKPVAVKTSNAGEDLLLVQLAVAVGPSQARIVLRYHGTVDAERARGIYRVDEGKTPYVYTFFEAVDARRAFPCFDEPSFKIPWTVSLTVPTGDVAFGNAAATSTVDAGGGMKTVTFAETRPLPSYLVAFVVGPFDVVPGRPAGNEGIPLQFIVPRGRAAELRYAQEIVPRVVTHLEDLTGVPYPYGKLDVAVVPRYWGTMEHPGLVALGQTFLLMRPDQESLGAREFAAQITTHELAHYWFGDLVTNAWWDETWLNESLGTWMDLKATDALDPDFRFRRKAASRRAVALAADALPTAKAVRQPVRTRTDIETSFDAALTYNKGSIVLGMFERWVGAPAWKRGMQLYLGTHADGNATADELFKALDEGTGRPVSQPLSTFVVQPGAPLVSVSLRCPRGELPVLELKQERFLVERTTPPPSALWQVPVCVRAAWGERVERACTLLSEAEGELSLPVARCPTLVVANDGGLGYYRVAYAPALRKALLEHPDRLDATEWVGLAGDTEALARRGDVPVGEALALGARLVKDRDAEVVAAGLALLELVHRDTLPPELRAAYAARLELLLGARARALGWRERTADSLDERRVRPVIVPRVAREGPDAVLRSEARRLAEAWLQDPRAVDADMVGGVLGTAGEAGDAALFDRLLEAARTRPTRQERAQAIAGLGRFQDPALAARARALLLDPADDLRDWLPVVYTQLHMPETRDAAYRFVDESFDVLSRRMRDDEVAQLLGRLGVFCDAGMRARVETSFARRAAKVDGGPFQLARSLEAIDQCARVEARLRPGVTAWLTQR
ncbi:MAG TPA: M1 family metallopeptidase [Myxococcaceae bacterium]|nr:M1 family metallopeptidase [Myxococcaceae bacterium]